MTLLPSSFIFCKRSKNVIIHILLLLLISLLMNIGTSGYLSWQTTSQLQTCTTPTSYCFTVTCGLRQFTTLFPSFVHSSIPPLHCEYKLYHYLFCLNMSQSTNITQAMDSALYAFFEVFLYYSNISTLTVVQLNKHRLLVIQKPQVNFAKKLLFQKVV
jgi:hypothetical protein